MKYILLLYAGLKKSLIYKKASLLTILSTVLTIYIFKLFWKVIYADDINGYYYMLRYSSISQILAAIYSFHLTIAADIRNGNISFKLARPYNYIAGMLFENLGSVLGNVILIGFPIIILTFGLIGEIYVTLSALVCGIISIVFAFLLLFFVKVLSELLCFWLIEAWAFGYVVSTLIRLFSGAFLPDFLVPKWFEKIMNSLPFIWIYQYPIQILIEKEIDYNEFKNIVVVQIIWLLLLGVLTLIIWRKGKKKVVIQGG